jgi:nitrile hydratase accessory protein
VSVPPATPDLDVDGAAAPPRSNGELVFEAPWESRVFGVTMALFEGGAFKWEEFRERLIAEIDRWEHDAEAGRKSAGDWCYYACWQAALESLLADKGLCDPAELESRSDAYAQRPPGHDHDH